jgi:hypothetical protein
MDNHHNPEIAMVFPEIDPKDEQVITRLHFIWLGSLLTNENSKNVSKWVVENQGCKFDIYIWYDGDHFIDQSIEPMENFVKHLNTLSTDKSVYLCNIREYPLMNLSATDDMKRSIEIYQYEAGHVVRPGMPDFSKEIRNWGMASDILRMLILYLYGGFYVDIDMVPKRLCELVKNKYSGYRTCKEQLCIGSYTNEYGQIATNNNAIYYHPESVKGKELILDFFKTVVTRYSWIENNPYWYILMDFRTQTLETSGPKNLIGNGVGRLTEFPEDLEIAKSSWQFSKSNDILRARLFHHLIQKPDRILSTLLYFYIDDMVYRKVYTFYLSETGTMFEILRYLVGSFPDHKPKQNSNYEPDFSRNRWNYTRRRIKDEIAELKKLCAQIPEIEKIVPEDKLVDYLYGIAAISGMYETLNEMYLNVTNGLRSLFKWFVNRIVRNGGGYGTDNQYHKFFDTFKIIRESESTPPPEFYAEFMGLYRELLHLDRLFDKKKFPDYKLEKYDYKGREEYVYGPMKVKFMDLIKKYNV